MDSKTTLPLFNARAYPVSDALQWSPTAVRNEQGLLGRLPRSDALHRSPGVVRSRQGLLGRSPRSDAPQHDPVVVKSWNGFSRHPRRVQVKKMVKKFRVRFASWNIGTLTGKSMELVDTMKRRRISIACLQETKWKGAKAREINGYKLWYIGSDGNRNGVGIVVEDKFKNKVVEVNRVNDRIIQIKLVLGEEVINVISVYAPQVGLDDRIKKQFWSDMDNLVQRIPNQEKLLIGGDLNGHVGKENIGYERIHGDFGFGVRNDMGEAILDFALAYDLVIVNTLFQKRTEHLITFKSGLTSSQIDFFLLRKSDRSLCKDCTVIPGESLTTQHRLLVLDIYVQKEKKEHKSNVISKIKWWNLKGTNMEIFKERMIAEGKWDNTKEVEVESMWNGIAECIRKVGQNILGVYKNSKCRHRETWWWNENVQKAINDKQEKFKKWQSNKNEINLQQYKSSKNFTKKVISEAKYKAYDDLYNRLGTRQGEKDIFKLARLRESRGKDLTHIRCIKGENQQVLVKDEEIKERWKNYFFSLLNGDPVERLRLKDSLNTKQDKNNIYFPKIRVSEVKEALRKMKIGKALGPDSIPIEVWKCMGDIGLIWLTNLFNKIIKTKSMPDEWRKSIIIPIYKNKGDIQNCANYRGIKLMSHTMKLWERVIEQRLRRETNISENQFGFMPGRSTTEAIFLLRQLMEKYREKKKNLHMIFIDLEKAYDRVPRELIWKVLEKKRVISRYIDIIKDMYEGTITNVRTMSGETSAFPIDIGLHQGSALSPYLFTLVMDELTKPLQEEVPWCMLFADDIVLIDETKEGVNLKLNKWRDALESKGFRISRTKTEYMKCNFNNSNNINEEPIKILDQVVPTTDHFRYLGSIVQESGDIEKDIINRIQVGWKKWQGASGILCDRRVPIKLKGKFYKTVIRPAMLYGVECWAIKEQHVHKMCVAEMRMLRWMSGKTRKDKIRNEVIQENLKVKSIGSKMRETRLRWFGHVKRRPENAPVRKTEFIKLGDGKRARGRPKKTWLEVIKKDMKVLDISESLVYNRQEWRKRIHAADPT